MKDLLVIWGVTVAFASQSACRESEDPDAPETALLVDSGGVPSPRGPSAPPPSSTATGDAITQTAPDTRARPTLDADEGQTAQPGDAASTARHDDGVVEGHAPGASDVVAPPGSQPAVEVFVDCNRATMGFGLTYYEKRYRIESGGSLDTVLRALSGALSRQADLVASEVPARYCGYADRVQCPQGPVDARSDGTNAWADVCRPFDEDRDFGGMGTALRHLAERAERNAGVGILLTHGLISADDGKDRRETDPTLTLSGMPVRVLAEGIIERGMSLTMVLVENVPFRYSTHGKLKLRRHEGKPVSPMAMLIWGRDDDTTNGLVAALVSELKPLSPKALRLASFDFARHGPVLASVDLRQTRAPAAGQKDNQPRVVSSNCKLRGDRAATCDVELVEPRAMYNQPQRDVLSLSIATAPAPLDTAEIATWYPGPLAEELETVVSAHYKGTSTAEPNVLGEVQHILREVAPQAAANILGGSTYLSDLPPLARCGDALTRLKKRVRADALDGPPGLDQRWSRLVLVPSRCLWSDEVLTSKGPPGLSRNPKRMILELAARMRPATRAENQLAVERIMSQAGWPESEDARDTVPGLRQAVLVLADKASSLAPKGDSPLSKIATIELVVK